MATATDKSGVEESGTEDATRDAEIWAALVLWLYAKETSHEMCTKRLLHPFVESLDIIGVEGGEDNW